MIAKITTTALGRIWGALPDDIVTLTLRISATFTEEEISKLTALGGRLLFDSGIAAVVNIPAKHVNQIAEWQSVLEIL